MIAFALVGACRGASAEAQPGGPPIPASWRALPELQAAVARAAGANDGVGAWGEPAMGCYAVSLALRGGAAGVDAMATQLLDGARAEQLAVTDTALPDAGGDRGVLAFAFARGAYHGRVRAELDADGAVRARACFWNDREPRACEAACAPLVGSAR